MTQRTDTCPDCKKPRVELVVVPGRFYCPSCQLAGPGPLEQAAGDQLTMRV